LGSAPDRVVVWAAQLAAGDFPPVCAMTGLPAETRRKFSFKTVPGWAHASGALAFTGLGLLAPVVEEAATRRASGYLPLTRASRRKLMLLEVVSLSLLAFMFVVWMVALIFSGTSDQTSSAIAGILFVLGWLCLLGFIVGLVVRPRIGPRGTVIGRPSSYHDNLVELRHVHPAFVAAVNQMQTARAAHYAALQTGPGIPTLPGST